MRIGILELLTNWPTSTGELIIDLLVNKQQVSLTPQALSVWCRNMGHNVYYTTWYGIGEPLKAFPDDLHIVFIATHTRTASLAYALAKLFKQKGLITVIGGPHAKSFPHDCLRYFDLVVLECDELLLSDLLRGEYPPSTIISSDKPFQEVPSIKERLPEIRCSNFLYDRPYPGCFIPMLASLGCPYSCDFCSDWNVNYYAFSSGRLKEDVEFASEMFPGVRLAFLDPNFGVRFDETISALESVAPERRSPYVIESSLKLLTTKRLERLRDTNCVALAPGVESWTDYSNKAGVGNAKYAQKLEKVVAQFHELHHYVPYLAANFMIGLDSDFGEEPFELTKEFMRQTPYVWPSLNIPMAFGGTPMYDTMLREGRILKTMPFSLYQIPYLMLIIKNYDPITYFEKLIDLHAESCSPRMLKMRFASTRHLPVKSIHYFRTRIIRRRVKFLQEMLLLLKTDKHFLDFHLGKTHILPSYYVTVYKKMLGKYHELVPVEESSPVLSEWPITPTNKIASGIPLPLAIQSA